jgi:transposase
MSQQQSTQQQQKSNQQQQQQQSNQQQSIASNINGKLKAEVPNPEVASRAKRRQFTAAYKLRILEEVDRCQNPGQIGALLRREGLYASHLSRWRQLRAVGQLQALGSQKRGRQSVVEEEAVVQLRQENERLRVQLAQAELVIDVQKKLSQLLGLMNETGNEKR